MRRALAIQLIINREFGLGFCENATPGSFIIEELTDLVEAAVLAEFDRLSERGGVLGAMELQYQRGVIQDDSLKYERAKHDGTLPIVGVNTFLPRDRAEASPPREVTLTRASNEEKEGCLERLQEFHEPPRRRGPRRPRQPQAGGDRRRQHLRRAPRHRAALLPRPDHPGALRGRRRVPEEHVAATLRARATAPGGIGQGSSDDRSAAAPVLTHRVRHTLIFSVSFSASGRSLPTFTPDTQLSSNTGPGRSDFNQQWAASPSAAGLTYVHAWQRPSRLHAL